MTGVVVGVVLTLVVGGAVLFGVIVLVRATNDHQAVMAVESRTALGVVLEHQRGMAEIEGRSTYADDPPAIQAPSRRRARVQIEPARDSWEEGY